jgi:hypothetical protein
MQYYGEKAPQKHLFKEYGITQTDYINKGE